MKVAISSSGPGLDAPIDPRLGRCECLLFVDPDTLKYETVNNENRMLGGGAGIQTARTIAERGAKVVLTGNCGPNASKTLREAGVRVLEGVNGTVREVLERYKKGEMSPVEQSSVQGHFEKSRGCGMAMGRGGGRGMGRGVAASLPLRPNPTESAAANEPFPGYCTQDEIAALEEQVQRVTWQLGELLGRIRELQKS